MKILTSKKLKVYINRYADSNSYDKNEFIYVHFRGVYDARIFGLCIIRNRSLFMDLKREGKQ